nr:hypothetical protein [Tanacetum cinerariifolium]
MCEMVYQIIQKKQEEKRIEEEQAANAQYWKIPACCDDDDDYNSAITPNEPVDSLSMRNEHLNTILTTESDELIKSSVEDLVQIPSESEGIPNTMCDVHLVNNLTPLEAKNHFEIVINSNDDISSSDDDYLYNENIEQKNGRKRVMAKGREKGVGGTVVQTVRDMGEYYLQFTLLVPEVKENQEKDKIGTKPDKNGKRGEAR